MSRLLARIMLAVLMLPVAALVYIVVFGVLYESLMRRRGEECFVVTGLITGAFVAAWWFLLWFRSVRWTAERVWLSLGSVPAALGVGACVGLGMAELERGLGAFLFGPGAVFSWLVLTVFVWRETARERARRIDVRGARALVCPACGYNLTGLTASTCPECGAAYTIDELLASQPGREDVELERPSAVAR